MQLPPGKPATEHESRSLAAALARPWNGAVPASEMSSGCSTFEPVSGCTSTLAAPGGRLVVFSVVMVVQIYFYGCCRFSQSRNAAHLDADRGARGKQFRTFRIIKR